MSIDDSRTGELTDVRSGTEYTFRRFRPSDVEDYLSLYETVYGVRHSPEWFRWRFVDIPYLNHVPVFVATSGGEVVATRPFFAFRMAVDGRRTLALLTVDTMVHPDHRRRGLFSTLTERSIEYYATREPSFVFNQPNGASRPGFVKLGWQVVAPTVKRYRVQHSRPFLTQRLGDSSRLVGPAVTALTKGALQVADAVRVDVDRPVRRVDGVPSGRLAELYRQRPPEAIHAVRDEAYYEWRFGSPEWRRRTYLVEGDRGQVGALTRTKTTPEGVTVTQIVDLVPMVGDEDWRASVWAVLDRVVDDHRDSDLLAAIPGAIPPDMLTAFGFLPDDRPPISWFSVTDVKLCVRPLAGCDDELAQRLFDSSRWLLSYGERDTT